MLIVPDAAENGLAEPDGNDVVGNDDEDEAKGLAPPVFIPPPPIPANGFAGADVDAGAGAGADADADAPLKEATVPNGEAEEAPANGLAGAGLVVEEVNPPGVAAEPKRGFCASEFDPN